MKREQSKERLVKVYDAPTNSEAMVVRGLLQSAGFHAPDFDALDPFPMHDPPEGWHSSEVWVPESQANEARQILMKSGNNNPATPSRKVRID